MSKLKHRYSDNIYHKKILIIGPYPPPYGGVEVHIKRVKVKLEYQDNQVRVFDTSPITTSLKTFIHLTRLLITTRPDIVYIHEPTLSRMRLFLSCMYKYIFRYTLISIDHNCTELYEQKGLHKKLFCLLMRMVDHHIVIGNTTCACYRDNNVPRNNSFSIESPFLSPPLREEQAILSRHQESVRLFIQERYPLISANAFELSFLNGKDLYGLDMCVDLIEKLKSTYPNIGLIFGLATDRNPEYLEQIRAHITKKSLDNNMYIHISNEEFWPLIKQSDLFVRPTQTDTFGISVQEAIVLGVQAIASNVCIRPKKTILYSLNNFSELTQKTFAALQNGEKKCKTSILSSCVEEVEQDSGR